MVRSTNVRARTPAAENKDVADFRANLVGARALDVHPPELLAAGLLQIFTGLCHFEGVGSVARAGIVALDEPIRRADAALRVAPLHVGARILAEIRKLLVAIAIIAFRFPIPAALIGRQIATGLAAAFFRRMPAAYKFGLRAGLLASGNLATGAKAGQLFLASLVIALAPFELRFLVGVVAAGARPSTWATSTRIAT